MEEAGSLLLEEQMEEAGSLLLEEQKETETGSLLLEEQMEETGSLLLEEREETGSLILEEQKETETGSLLAFGGADGGDRDRISDFRHEENPRHGKRRIQWDKSPSVNYEKSLSQVQKRQKRHVSLKLPYVSLVFRHPLQLNPALYQNPPVLNQNTPTLNQNQSDPALNQNPQNQSDPGLNQNPQNQSNPDFNQNPQNQSDEDAAAEDESETNTIFEFGSSSYVVEDAAEDVTHGHEWRSFTQLLKELDLKRKQAAWLFNSYLVLSHLRDGLRELGFLPLLEIAQDPPKEGESYGEIRVRLRPRGPNDKLPNTNDEH